MSSTERAKLDLCTADIFVVDVETLSTRFDAKVLSIGAAFYDANTKCGATFYAEFGDDGGHMDMGTWDWWTKQNKQWFEAVYAGTNTVAPALGDFCNWVERHNTDPNTIFASRGNFDFPILESCIRRNMPAETQFPWKYWQTFDIRCMQMLFPDVEVPVNPLPHHALSDAAHELGHLLNMIEALRRMKGEV